MLGYLKNSELTAQVIDKERWFHSGDIGYYDSDGFIYIIERLKEFIRYTDLKVNPECYFNELFNMNGFIHKS